MGVYLRSSPPGARRSAAAGAALAVIALGAWSPGVAGAAHAPAAVAVRATGASTLLVVWRWEAHTSYQVRWRAGRGRWHARHAGRSGQLRLGGLRTQSTAYQVEVRGCTRRCSSWSAPARAGGTRSPSGNPQRSPGGASSPSVGAGSSPASGDLPVSGPPSQTRIGGCSVFPANNPWNQDVSQLPVDPQSAAYIASINGFGDTNLHADFGSDPTYGIPYRVENGAASVPISFNEYPDESDPGPYPVPTDSPIEGGNDHHVLVVDQSACRLYELYHAAPSSGGWQAGSGAVFDLNSNALRPDTWTSTDEAGLPVLPGLARYDEVQSGAITHALRFTVAQTQRAFIHPATHYGQSDSVGDPPLGLRLRLRADFDLTPYTGEALVILQALKRYGMFVADTGTSWYISGATDPRWSDDDLNQLKTVPGGAFEAVQTGPVHRPS